MRSIKKKACKYMKNLTIALLAGFLIQPTLSLSAEGLTCNIWYEKVDRKVNLIKSYGPNLSRMAQDKLYDDLKFDTKQCLAECEGEKFKLCNQVAFAIEQKKPLQNCSPKHSKVKAYVLERKPRMGKDGAAVAMKRAVRKTVEKCGRGVKK